MVFERWLPGLGTAIGLSLMVAAAVAQGQPAPGQTASPSARPMAAPRHDGDRLPRAGGGWDRRDLGGGFRAMTPEQICKERFARKAGFVAYLGAKLELTASQQPLWDKYQQAMLESAAKLRQICLDNAGQPRSDLTVLERRDRMEKLLTTRLDGLHATRAPLDALYQSLSPDQRGLMDGPGWLGSGPKQ